MRHQVSQEDLEFQRSFEACEVLPAAFDHAAHVRLAYIYLCNNSIEMSAKKMKHSLVAFLKHIGAGEEKYHETITCAWVMAVSHFMTNCTKAHHSASTFMHENPDLLDSGIMLTHYSAGILFSTEARSSFVQPDIQLIPPDKDAGTS